MPELPELPNDAPKGCKDALEEVREAKDLDPNTVQVSLDEQHTLYRAIVEKHLDKSDSSGRTIKPTAFDDQGMSVFAEGPNLPALEFAQVKEKYPQFVGFVKIDSKLVSEHNLKLVHDPYEVNGKRHPNHAIVICRKNMTTCKAILSSHTWAYPQTDADGQPGPGEKAP